MTTRCSVESLNRGEPLYATASLVSAWLLIEQPGAWGPDALTESKFPGDIAAELKRRASGVRILLIRRRTASADIPVYFKAHSGGEALDPILVSAPMPDPSVLLDVDFEALAAGHPGAGDPVEHPIYLVCTHGRHDICCADNGRPLYRELCEMWPETTWEVSHLGGDRFAGNMLVLPRGDYFGRVEPIHAVPLVSEYQAGRLDLARYRGRSTRPRLVQAAEHFVRESTGLTGFDDVTVTAYRRPAHRDRAEVEFDLPSGRVRVEVVAGEFPDAALLTCRADRPNHPVGYELVEMTRD